MNKKEFGSSMLDQLNVPWVERKGFSHWGMALLWLVFVFLASQLVVAIVSVAILYATGAATNMQELMMAMETRLDVLFIGNSVGQILILGLATFLVAGLHTGKESKLEFLRIRWSRETTFYMITGGLLILVIQPVVMYLGYLNSFVPTPDIMEEIQANQYQMFRDYLTSDGVMLIGLFHVAVVPALAEEVLFRGYILRAFEKSRGIIFALILSSLIFSMFHLQLTNVLPLATLGAVMGLVTWLSGSLWPAVLAHFLNNGAAVLMATFMPDQAFGDITLEALPPVWVLALSIVFTVVLVRFMYRNSNHKLPS